MALSEQKNKIAIETENISFSFGKLKALDNLSLQVPVGISFGLLGPNGSGKTTLIRLLVGLLKPHQGKIKVLGQDLSRKMSPLLGYMPQQYSLYTELSVAQNIDFFAKIYLKENRPERAKRTEQILRIVGLWERRKDGILKLSGGMKQRVSLACAMVHNPPLLFLDEPTVGLDPELRATFWQHFADLNKQGVTIIISSHTMDDAAHCNRLAFLRLGKIIAEGTPDQLRQATGQVGTTLEDAFLFFVRRTEQSNA